MHFCMYQFKLDGGKNIPQIQLQFSPYKFIKLISIIHQLCNKSNDKISRGYSKLRNVSNIKICNPYYILYDTEYQFSINQNLSICINSTHKTKSGSFRKITHTSEIRLKHPHFVSKLFIYAS